MELLQLKYFQVVARLQHITRAANELNISQPSLSIMISRLEDELGTDLFVRKGRNIELNEIGKAFLRHVNTILTELESAKLEVEDMIGKQSKHITLATTNPRILFGVLKEYLSINPSTTVQQFFNTSDVVKVNLKAGKIDFCITVPPLKDNDLEISVLMEDEIFLVVPSDHRLADRTSIKLNEVSEDSFILLAENYSYRQLIDEYCHAAGFTPKVAFEVDDALMYEMMQLGRGITLLPKYICYAYESTAHKMVKINEPICKMEVGFSWLKGRYFSETALNFKNFVIDYFKNQNL